MLGSGPASARPNVPGLNAEHPLDEVGRGRVLIEELRCAACHDGMGESPPGPDLATAGSRLNPAFMRDFIADPARHDPGTKMPHLMGGLGERDRAELAESLAAYLLSRPQPEPEPLAKADPELGRERFHEVGCVACHSPRSGAGAEQVLPGNVGLDHVARKYRPSGLADFLHTPLAVRPAGRMPDLMLQRAEAEAIAAFMLTTTERADEAVRVPSDADRVAAGRKAFVEMRCVACHSSGEELMPAAPAAPEMSASLRLDQGCLSETPGAAPGYGLDEGQRQAVRAALKAASEPEPAGARIDRRLTQLNCIACHQRDGHGGVHPERDSFFKTTEESLGDSARIPPPLTGIGAKLRKEWLHKVLHERERVRPYMTTRMPHYGDIALADLVEELAEFDAAEPFEYPEPDRESGPMMRNGGHLLVGNKGLACIACHNFNGMEGPGMHGIDLMTTYQRLQPGWFDGFMRNPAEYRPGIIMPSFWPGGQAVQTEILEGDTGQQLAALYHYFSLGRSARDPDGLKAEDSNLMVEDEARTYRGRSNVAGYRGIAVGHPGGWNFAFNAQTGTLSALWKGGYVNVNWRGQGAGNFNPAERAVQLSQDVSLLIKPLDPWPAHPVRTKEQPANPDPLYPRQYGYAFEGYSTGAGGVPTFRYRSGGVEVTDTAVPEGDGAVLRRTLGFESGEETRRYFRALTGAVEKVSDSVFQTPALRLELRGMPSGAVATLRDGGENVRDLVIELPLAAGHSKLILDYALRN